MAGWPSGGGGQDSGEGKAARAIGRGGGRPSDGQGLLQERQASFVSKAAGGGRESKGGSSGAAAVPAEAPSATTWFIF